MDRVILLFGFAVLLFASPLTPWLAHENTPWYLPYVIWLGVIGLAAWLNWDRRRHDF